MAQDSRAQAAADLVSTSGREGCLAGSGDVKLWARTPTTAASLLLSAPAQESSTGLLGQDILVPFSTREGRGPSHPAIQSSFRGEAKKFKASGSGNPPHKSRWMLASNIQQIWSPGELSFAKRPPCVLNAAAPTVHNPGWSWFVFTSSTTADNKFLWLEKCCRNAGTCHLGCST